MTENQKLLVHYATLRRLFALEATSILKESGLGFRQFVIIHSLNEQEEMTLSELVDTCMTDKATVTRSVGQLISGGLVEKTQSKSDRRVWNVRLTKKGKDLIPQIDGIHRHLSDIFFGCLQKEEKTSLKILLSKLTKNLKN